MLTLLSYLVAFLLICQSLMIIFYKKHKRYINYGNDSRSPDDYIENIGDMEEV
jgi:hypothetical protein